MERASLARLISLLVKFPASLRLKTSTRLGAIHLSIKYKTAQAVVEDEAIMADVLVVAAPIMEEEVAVEEEVVEVEAAEEAALQLGTPVGVMTGMICPKQSALTYDQKGIAKVWAPGPTQVVQEAHQFPSLKSVELFPTLLLLLEPPTQPQMIHQH
jgi:hypothetical protein